MIPVAPFSLLFLLIITLGPLALIIVLVWVGFAFSTATSPGKL